MLHGESGGAGRWMSHCVIQESSAADGFPAAIDGAAADHETAHMDAEVFCLFQVGDEKTIQRRVCRDPSRAFCPSCGNRSLKRVQAVITNKGVVGVGDFPPVHRRRSKQMKRKSWDCLFGTHVNCFDDKRVY